MYTGNIALYVDGKKYRSFDQYETDILSDFRTWGCIGFVPGQGGARYVPLFTGSGQTMVDGNVAPINLPPYFCLSYKACTTLHVCGCSSYGVHCWYTTCFKDICLTTNIATPSRPHVASIEHSAWTLARVCEHAASTIGFMDANSVVACPSGFEINTSDGAMCFMISNGAYLNIPLEVAYPQTGYYFCEQSFSKIVNIPDAMWCS